MSKIEGSSSKHLLQPQKSTGQRGKIGAVRRRACTTSKGMEIIEDAR